MNIAGHLAAGFLLLGTIVATPVPEWKIGVGPCLVGAGDLFGASFGAGIQWDWKFWAVGFESRFQSATWAQDPGDEFRLSTPYRVHDQHSSFQQDFEVLGKLPLKRVVLYLGVGPSYVYYRQLTQDWVIGNSSMPPFFRHSYSDFGYHGIAYHSQAGIDYRGDLFTWGLFFKVGNFGDTKNVTSLNLKISRPFGFKS